MLEEAGEARHAPGEQQTPHRMTFVNHFIVLSKMKKDDQISVDIVKQH